MKSTTAFAVLALALAPAAALAQGSPPNDAAHPAAGAMPPAEAAPAMPRMGEPSMGRSSAEPTVRQGEQSMTPSSGETRPGDPPVGMGRGEK